MWPSRHPVGSAALDRALAGLEEKYAGLVALRREREAAEAAGRSAFEPETGGARVAAFRALAARFPGALRQLDAFDAEALEARRAAVATARAAGGAGMARWIAITLDYHAVVRETLAVKAWLGGRDDIDDATLVAVREWLAPREERVSEVAELDRDWLDAIATPEGGKVQTSVWRRLEAAYAITREEILAAIFE